jgi:imidazolonepropionase-like amidohydrolase
MKSAFITARRTITRNYLIDMILPTTCVRARLTPMCRGSVAAQILASKTPEFYFANGLDLTAPGQKLNVVPTLVLFDRGMRLGKQAGLSQLSLDKMKEVQRHGLEAFAHCVRAGVKLAFGTDLLGVLHSHQTGEFLIRREVAAAVDILKSATSINAALLNQSGLLGVIAAGAYADLLVVDGNPLEDISLLDRNGESLLLIMKGGAIYKDALH